ncbi:hypothetical protein GCM10009716_27100 [Streptomyces sodiiphilus]|uniref:HTH cro/C1-type domain-containing protein n=1 Tax=Streptomyces sodiiphilus TaxID=226217 RepID=A0ABP5AP38_9ACTN
MTTRNEARADEPELAHELRRLRRSSGLTLAALARRTSYSKSSWERYLNGKTVPPKQAVIAFAQAVDVRAEPLLRLHERAEAGTEDEGREESPEAASGVAAPPPSLIEEAPAGYRTGPGRPVLAYGTSPGEDRGAVEGRGTSEPLWRRLTVLAAAAAVAGLGFAAGMMAGSSPPADDTPGAGAGAQADLAGNDMRTASQLDGGGVGCTGFECKGQDPQRLGCHIGVWTAAVAREGDLYVELRYSPSCRAAWSRITEGSVGDVTRVEEVQGTVEERAIRYDHDTYSPMVEAPYPAAARACALLTDGREICTPFGGASPLPEAPTNEAHRD